MPGKLESRSGARAVESDRPSSRLTALVLATGVVLSVLVYGFASGGSKGVWILPDELGYGLLARSFAATGRFTLRGVGTLVYPVGYPALISPAFAGRGPVAAYDAAKWLNAVLMSLAAVPAFLIARRVLSSRLALLAAAFTLLIPSMAYVRVIMSENAFFLVFLLAMLAFVRALESPTVGRQIVALLVTLPVVAVRAEGIIVIPILLLAMVLYAVSNAERSPPSFWRAVASELSRFRATWAVLPLGVAALIAGEAAVGKAPTAIFGRYASSLQAYPFWLTLRWSLYQLVDLELYVVVIPLVGAALVAFTLLRRSGTPAGRRAVAALAIPAVVISIFAAGAASATAQGGPGESLPYIPAELHDRYCFFVVPFVFILFVVWFSERREFSGRALAGLMIGASGLPLVLPFANVHANADFDAFALLPWSNGLIAGRNVHFAMAVTAALLCLIAVPRRKSIALLQVSSVVLGLLIMNAIAESEVGDASTHVGSSRFADRAWVDEAVPDSVKVAVVWNKDARWSPAQVIRREQALWRAEFLNTSIAAFFDLHGPMHYNLPEARGHLRHGRLVLPGPTRYRFVLTASSFSLDGKVVATDRKAGLTLFRLNVPTRP